MGRQPEKPGWRQLAWRAAYLRRSKRSTARQVSDAVEWNEILLGESVLGFYARTTILNWTRSSTRASRDRLMHQWCGWISGNDIMLVAQPPSAPTGVGGLNVGLYQKTGQASTRLEKSRRVDNGMVDRKKKWYVTVKKMCNFLECIRIIVRTQI